MTRIFGFDRQSGKDTHIPMGIQKVFENLQEAAIKTYEKGWQAYGMGFIIVGADQAKGFSVYKGYQGIKSGTNIQALLPENLHLALANSPKAFFGVLQNSPDTGEEDFNLEDVGRKFPIESENWLVISMGWWGNNNFSDENLLWYCKTRPVQSLVQYLETNPKEIDFSWVDPKRTPFIIAVKKSGDQICIVDGYTDKNEKGFKYVKEDYQGMLLYQGVRNHQGEQV